MRSNEASKMPLWRSAWAALTATLPDRASLASLEMVCTMLAASVAAVMAILSSAHVAEGRWWYVPAAITAFVIAALRLVSAHAWRSSARSLHAIERAVAGRANVVWTSISPVFSHGSLAFTLWRPIETLSVISGVAQLGAAAHRYHTHPLVFVASALLALLSFLVGVALTFFSTWIVMQYAHEIVALSIERSTGDGVLRCALYGAAVPAADSFEVTVCDERSRPLLPVRVEDRSVGEDGALRFSVRCAVPSSVNWALDGAQPMRVRVRGVAGVSLFFDLPNKLDELRPRALV